MKWITFFPLAAYAAHLRRLQEEAKEPDSWSPEQIPIVGWLVTPVWNQQPFNWNEHPLWNEDLPQRLHSLWEEHPLQGHPLWDDELLQRFPGGISQELRIEPIYQNLPHVSEIPLQLPIEFPEIPHLSLLKNPFGEIPGIENLPEFPAHPIDIPSLEAWKEGRFFVGVDEVPDFLRFNDMLGNMQHLGGQLPFQEQFVQYAKQMPLYDGIADVVQP